jgi:hypothetical protein
MLTQFNRLQGSTRLSTQSRLASKQVYSVKRTNAFASRHVQSLSALSLPATVASPFSRRWSQPRQTMCAAAATEEETFTYQAEVRECVWLLINCIAAPLGTMLKQE